MLNIEALNVSYPDSHPVLKDLNLEIHTGEHVALVGANGAGKTSLMLAMLGVIPIQSGTIQVAGITLDSAKRDKSAVEQIRRKAGMVFQNPDDQLFMPTIYEDVAFGPRNLGVDCETVRYRVEDRLERLGIAHLRDRSALHLSGGEKRLAAMATVLAMKPELMLLDEPTAFLDPKARRNLINILKSLPHTMLIATHDLTFAGQVCDRTVVLCEGRIYADGKSADLLYDAACMEAAGIEAIGADTF